MQGPYKYGQNFHPYIIPNIERFNQNIKERVLYAWAVMT